MLLISALLFLSISTLHIIRRSGYVLLCMVLSCASFGQQVGRISRMESTGFIDTVAILKQIDQTRILAKDHPDSALFLTEQYLQHSQELGFSYGIGMALSQKGLLLVAKNRYQEGEEMLLSAISYLKESGSHNEREISYICSNIGTIYMAKDDYEKASAYYYQSIAVGESAQPPVNMGHVYSNLGGLLTQLGRDPRSVNYYLDKAKKAALAHNDYALLSKVYNNKGFSFNSKKQWDSSLYYFNKVAQISREHQLSEAEFLSQLNIGIVYLEKKEPRTAIPHLLEARSLQSYAKPNHSNMLLGALGNAYLQMGDYQQAESLLLEQYRQAIESGRQATRRDAHYNLSRLYGATKAYDQAYRHAWSYIMLNNDLGGEEIIQNVNKQEVSFRTAEKDRDLLEKKLIIEAQKRSIEQKNRWLVIIISGTIIFLLLLLIVIKTYRSRQRHMKQKFYALQQRREIERLKATIEGEERERNRIARDLHDGIGGLIAAVQINVRALGKEIHILQSSDMYHDTNEILEEASTELRKTAHNMLPSVLLHQSLEDAINDFCRYVKQDKRLDIDAQMHGDMNLLPDSYKITIYRIVQELIHNIIKHAHATQVLVQLVLELPLFSITIEDNGIGFDLKDKVYDKGIGLTNIRTRVENMQGAFSLDTEPGKGCSVYIELDIPKDAAATINDLFLKELL